MILNESAIVSVHHALLANGSLGDAYSRAGLGCVQLIEKVARSRGRHINGRAEIAVVLDLGARMVNSCGAAGRLILCGYWSPAAHQCRDIAECHQLVEYFRLHPERAADWLNATGKTRFKGFKFGNVQTILLNTPSAKDVGDVKVAFDFYSNVGSHPSIEGLSLHMTADGIKNIGPTANPKRFLVFAADLWAYMTRATLRFVDTVEHLMPDHPKIATEFRYEFAVVLGWQKFLSPIDADDITNWIAATPA
ncbi:hypothetical protein [Mesorhizobium marinum]|uniref:hypothetical protein n=1 Tax=Mesorhizobium marinum TaxID=3228790 RepID=UPI0034671429